MIATNKEPVYVIFQYDHEEELWDIIVTGAINEKDALDAFIATVKTCDTLDPEILRLSRVKEIILDEGSYYEIKPAVEK